VKSPSSPKAAAVKSKDKSEEKKKAEELSEADLKKVTDGSRYTLYEKGKL
jgi:hypothetical protein